MQPGMEPGVGVGGWQELGFQGDLDGGDLALACEALVEPWPGL